MAAGKLFDVYGDGQFEFELMKLSRLLNKNFMTINGNLILNFCLKIIAHTPVLTAGNLGTSGDTILPFEFMTILSYLTYFFMPDVCFVNMHKEIRHLLYKFDIFTGDEFRRVFLSFRVQRLRSTWFLRPGFHNGSQIPYILL